MLFRSNEVKDNLSHKSDLPWIGARAYCSLSKRIFYDDPLPPSRMSKSEVVLLPVPSPVMISQSGAPRLRASVGALASPYLSRLRRDSVGADFQSVRKLTNYVCAKPPESRLSHFSKVCYKLRLFLQLSLYILINCLTTTA